MTTSREIILIGGVVHTLNKMESWAAETHVQKTAFVAKHISSIPLDAGFILYKYGPYSFDLNKSIGHMIARKVLFVEPHSGYGPSLRLNEPLWAALDEAAGGVFRKYKGKITNVCHLLANKNVADLEKVCTAIYISINYGDLSREQQVMKLSEVKPHIARGMARTAFEEASSIFERLGFSRD